MVQYLGKVAAMELDHNVQLTNPEMFHLKIVKLENSNEVAHRPAGIQLWVDTVQAVVTQILSECQGKFVL